MEKKKLPPGIRQRANGRYEGRIKHNYRSYSVYADTITETKKKLAELKYKLEHGTFVEKSKITLDEWFSTWMEEYKKNSVKKGTYYNYWKYYNSMVKDRLGKQRLSDIRGEHIQRFYNSLTEKNYAQSSIKIVSAILNGCFKQAEINGIIEKNPVKLAILPKKGERIKKEAMTKEQQQVFMRYAEDSYLYNLFAVMLRTGLRSVEIRGLKFSDIDKSKGVLHIVRTLKYIEGIGYFEDTPKTKTSKRDIPLTEDVLHYLEAQKRYWNFNIETFGRYLFCNEKGEPLSRDRLQAEINRIVLRAKNDGIELGHITPHIFRHTFATRAIEAGMQPQILKTILGHSSLSMTMDLYSHVLPDVKSEEMQKISCAF